MTPPNNGSVDPDHLNDEQRALIDELVQLRAILDKKNLRKMYARCGVIYNQLIDLGLTRRQVSSIAGLTAVGMDWGKKAAVERGAGVEGARTTKKRTKRRTGADSSS